MEVMTTLYPSRGSKYAVLGVLALLLTLFCAAQGAYPPEADLSVYKEAVLAGNATAEIAPGTAFDYVITVTNHDPSHSAPEAVVTDKLPYEVAFRSINVSSSLGQSTFSISGDLIYVRFDLIPPSSTGQITISVTAPTQAPTTIYNIANIRYGNDPNPDNNRMTISTYVPLLGYDQLGAAGGLTGNGASESHQAPVVSGCQSCQRG
ncbi:MAG: hypothetical protein CG443_244 [Methanosaeta sp. ASP1-1]|nr:MAG: hypothetical protein CG443_244 [Methanosaeta sp. ASP1-1]